MHKSIWVLYGSCLLAFVASSVAVRGETITSGDMEVEFYNDAGPGSVPDARDAFVFTGGTKAGVHFLYSGWWAFREPGDTDESAFHSPTTESFVGDTATLAFSETNFDADLTMVLGANSFVHTMIITNTSGASLDLNLFHLSDVDLGDNENYDDSAVLTGSDHVVVTSIDAPPPGTSGLTVVANGATAAVAGDVDEEEPGLMDIYGLMDDGLITNFTNGTGFPFVAATDGDFNAGFQWTPTFDSGETLTFETTYTLTPVPEPSSLLLAGIGALGLFGYGRRRRQTSAA